MSKMIEQNKTFNQLSAAHKRVAIARDVLDSIESRKLRGRSGLWVELDLRAPASEKLANELDALDNGSKVEYTFQERQLETVLNEDTKVCRVCAIGGLFVCAVKRKNKITLEDCRASTYNTLTGDVALDGEVAMEYLQKFFSTSQLHLIELAFEGGSGGELANEENPRLDEQSAIAFGKRFVNDTARMRALMLNIIYNEGTFTPPVLSPNQMKVIREEAEVTTAETNWW